MSDSKSVYSSADIDANCASSVPLREGDGSTCFAFSKTQTPDRSPVKCVARATLMPGASLRRHRHVNDGEVYYILSGSGTYYDNDGNAIPVKAGDATVCLVGDEHGISNTGTEPLVFLGIVN